MAEGISPILPLITSGSSTQGWGSGPAFGPKLPKPASSELTALQALEAYLLSQKGKKKKRGFLGSVASGSWKGISGLLDIITRPSYAVAEGTRRALQGDDDDFDVKDFFSGAWAGLSGKKKTGFGQILREHNIAKGFAGGALGFGLDVVTDPVMLASIAAAPVTGGASLALTAERLAARGLSLTSVQRAAKVAEKGSDNIDELRAAYETLRAAGDGFHGRAALAEARYVEKVLGPEYGMTRGKQSTLHGLEAYAASEARNELPRVLSFQYKIPFANATKGKYFENGRVVLRTPFKTVGIKTIADLKIPLVSRIAESLGQAFKPGWRNEKFHALERVGRSTVEVREQEYIAAIGNILKQYISPKSEKFLPQEAQLDALDWGETARGVVKNLTDSQGNVRSRWLNRPMIQEAVQAGRLTPQQAEFLQDWHKATEVLSDADMDYGRLYGGVLKTADKDGQDVIYVPHIYTKDGRKLTETLGTSILTKPGFEYARLSNKPNSVKQLKALHEVGEYQRLVETDPIKLLVMRARRGAQSHADRMVENVIATAEGIPTKIANVAKQQEHIAAIAARQEKLAKLPLATPEGFDDAVRQLVDEINTKVDVRRNEALAKHDARTSNLRKETKSLRDSIRRRADVPSGNQVVHMSSKMFNELFAGEKLAGLRKHGLRVRSVFAAAQSARRNARAFKPTSVNYSKAHGSKYKGLLGRLFDDAKLADPRVRGKTDKLSVYQGKHYRAYSRDLKNLRQSLLLTPLRKGESWEQRLQIATTQLEKRARDDWQAALNDIGYKAPPRNRRSALAAKQKALNLHLSRRDRVNELFDQRRDVILGKQLDKLKAKQARQIKAAATHQKLIDKSKRAIEYHETSLDNPIAKRPGYVSNDKIKAENGKPMAIPAEIDEAIRRIRQVIYDDQFLADFQRTWSRLLGKWKVGVTVVNPGYRLRNTISDMWNMFISPEGGVPLWAMGKYGALAGDIIYKKIPAGDKEALRLFQEAYEHSVMSGLFGGDIEKVLRTMRSGFKDEPGREFAKEGRLIKAWTTGATRFNRNAENWGRLTHYLYRRLHQGKSPAEAARIVRIAHFDYEDLTPTERKIKGYLVPFYTWTRNNIPYQLQQMLSSPGRYSTFQKLANEMEYAAGGDEGIAPDWIKQNLGFRIPFGSNNYFLPQFGPSDLAKLQSPSQSAGLLGPFVKTPIELMTNKSLLTGTPIYGKELAHPRSPVSGPAASILGLLPGSNVGTTARQVNGQIMRGPGANPILSYIAGQTPITNVLVNQMSNIRRAQRGRNASLLSYFGGLSTYSPDREQTLGIAEQEWNKSFRQFVRGLRDEGRWPEVEDTEPSAFDKKRRKLLEQVLANQ